MTLIFLMVIMSLSLNGCTKKEYIYVKVPCPKLQTFEINLSEPTDIRIEYNVKDINESSRTN